MFRKCKGGGASEELEKILIAAVFIMCPLLLVARFPNTFLKVSAAVYYTLLGLLSLTGKPDKNSCYKAKAH